MKDFTRRTFVKGTAATAGAMVLGGLFPGAWLSLARAEQADYFEKEFGITQAICNRVLQKALQKGGDFSELYFEHTIDNWVLLEDGQVNKAYGDVDLGVGIRTVKGDQIGYGFTQELTEESMLAAAATAASIADGPSVIPEKRFIQLKTESHYPMDRLLSEVGLSEKLPIVQSVNDLCFKRNNAVIKVSAGFHDSQKRIMIVTSDGMKAEDLLPRSYLYGFVTAEKDGRREKGWWNLGGRREFSFYTPEVVEEIAHVSVDRAMTLFEAIQPPAGEMPAVLGPGVTGILLHEAIGHGMEADFNRKGVSTFTKMLGKKVAETMVSIVDDGTNEKLLGSINVDDEGTPGQKTHLVENGVLTSYLHDKISSRHYNVKPTGSGRRQSYKHFPLPRMRNTYMQPGPETVESVIKSVKKGIYIEGVSNGQVKIGEGDFAFYVSQGRLIEDGKLGAPIKDVNIMGNGPKMLRNIVSVADDLEMSRSGSGYCGKDGQRVPVSFGLPTVLVKSMTVGGTGAKGGQS
jgi:TldD protein